MNSKAKTVIYNDDIKDCNTMLFYNGVGILTSCINIYKDGTVTEINTSQWHPRTELEIMDNCEKVITVLQ